MTNRQIDPEAHRVIVGNVPESRLDELMGLISDFAITHSLPVAVQPNESPALEPERNPGGYNPLLVSYVEGPGEETAIPILPIHKLSVYAKNNGYAYLRVDGFPKPYGDDILINRIWRLGQPGVKYQLKAEYTIRGILRADTLEELIVEARKRPDEYKFSEAQISFLEVCAANLKLDPPHPLRPSPHVSNR